jgi:hypothetical protein
MALSLLRSQDIASCPEYMQQPKNHLLEAALRPCFYCEEKKSDRSMDRTFRVTFQLFELVRDIGKDLVSFLNFSKNTSGCVKGGIRDACNSQNPENFQEPADD